MGKPVLSMTGFGSTEGEIAGQRFRIEIKTLNHRFLDVKMRLPRELSSAEVPFRAAIQSEFARGSVEVKVDRVLAAEVEEPSIQPNLGLAAGYYEAMISIQRTLGLADSIRTVDVAAMPDVIAKTTREFPPEEAWLKLEPLARSAISRLTEMRAHEGSSLARVLREAIAFMESAIDTLRSRRESWETLWRDRTRERIGSVFEAHPMADTSIQAVLETRIAQELAILLDRTDIEEELTRFKGHLAHFLKVLDAGGPIGRKLDFILQELNREINTLGNKAQDIKISEEVVDLKVRLEQMREQVMNLE